MKLQLDQPRRFIATRKRFSLSETNNMKKIPFKWIGIVALLVLVVIQFIPSTNNNGIAEGPNDITHVVTVPDSVMTVLKTSCYDCHSNHTDYMWYSHIQPIGFWIENHVNEGKRHLNFSEYLTFKTKRKKHKLEEVAEQVETHEMPLWTYELMHKNAALNDAQLAMLKEWATQAAAGISLDSTGAHSATK